MKQSPISRTKQFIQGHLFVFGVLTLLVSSWFFTYYLKAEKKLTFFKNEIQNLQNHQKNFFADKQSKRTLKKTVASLEHRLNATLGDTPKEKENSSHKITSIARKIQKHRLTLTSCKTNVKEKKDWFSKQNITYTLQGSFKQVSKLIETLCQKSRNLKCKKLLLAKTQNNQTQLELELQFLFFKKM